MMMTTTTVTRGCGGSVVDCGTAVSGVRIGALVIVMDCFVVLAVLVVIVLCRNVLPGDDDDDEVWGVVDSIEVLLVMVLLLSLVIN